MRRLGRIEQEVDLSGGLYDPSGPNPSITAGQRRGSLAGEAPDKPPGDVAVLVIEVRVARTIGDVDDCARGQASRWGANGSAMITIIP